jgi:CRISPR-associated protein Csb2
VPLSLDVELLTGSYDAAEVDDRRRGEWPPHPARLFSALVSAARTEDDRAALRWLEAQPSPCVVADAAVSDVRREAFVVTNKVEQGGGGSLTHPARTNGLRARTRTIPASPRVSMRWTSDAAPEVVVALDAMARRIPYLGRSTGVVLVAAAATSGTSAAQGDTVDGRPVYEPCAVLEADVNLRVPYPGFLEELDAQYEADRPAWEVARYSGYRLRRPVEPARDETTVPSVYTDVVVFGFTDFRPDGRLTSRFTEALRTAVLRRCPDAPNVVHGHEADGRPHVAFLALPDVGGPHSDGHLLGMAVAVPELPKDERKRVLAAILSLRGSDDPQGQFDLRVPGIGRAGLVHRPGLVRPWGASPERWRQGSRRWVTATPMVLDRFPKRESDVADEVLASVRRLGLPDPVDLRISTQPLQTGAVRLRPHELPEQSRKRLYRHVELVFDRRVSGPVLVGAGRYLGVGLFAPAASADVARSVRGDDG